MPEEPVNPLYQRGSSDGGAYETFARISSTEAERKRDHKSNNQIHY